MMDTSKTMTGLMVAGFFILLPLLLVGLVVKKGFLALQEALQPLLDALPGTVFTNPDVRFLLVCIAIMVLLLLVGWLARTRPGQTIGKGLETKFLERMPLYSLLRNLCAGLSGSEDGKAMTPVLVTVDVPGLAQLGFIVERLPDGSATVFLPSSPNPSSGTVVVVEPARIRELKVPGRKILSCMSRWGQGTAALLEPAGEAERGGGKDK